jgi:exodeoxyribonuclease V alpha subunit
MNAHYKLLGLEDLDGSTHLESSRYEFQQRLRNLATSAIDLNLSSQSIHLAAEIAALDPALDFEQRIVLIVLIVVSLAALEEGSTRFPVTGPASVEPMRRLLTPLCGSSFGDDGVERMLGAIERLLASGRTSGVVGCSPTDYKPLVYLAPYIYQHRSLSAETKFARRMASLMEAEPLALTSPELGLASRDKLSNEQIAAVKRAVAGSVTIIAGGPGTGKTSIIIAILRALVTGGIGPSQIMLAAPTGKAAYRIAESIRQTRAKDANINATLNECPEPSTLHRLLGYSPTTRQFRYHRNNPLAADAVIVDEASMLDLELVSRLLDALRRGTRLVLLGDADQLPSVSAGAVFRDLLPSVEDGESAPLARSCVRLSHSYRMSMEGDDGARIFKLANAIKAGTLTFSIDADDLPIVAHDSVDQLEFRGVEWLNGNNHIGTFLDRWYEKHSNNSDHSDLEKRVLDSIDSGFGPPECETIGDILGKLSRSRILCVTRVLDAGSERLNESLHRRTAREVGLSAERERFIGGEPVMVLRNDYERMLFNGDQGVVLWVRRPGADPARMAVFPRADNFVAFDLDTLKDQIELCYAMTVHKAQGSEFDSVALMLPEKDLPILSRELLYTAVSRARRSVTIVGSKEVMESGLARKIERYSGVRERLAECLNESLRT